MDSEPRLPNLEPEDIFAEAIARIEAGEPLEAVLAAYPGEHEAELRSMLQIVVVASQIQHAPVPRPSAARRAANKQAFLQAAAELRVERAVAAPPVIAARDNAGMTFVERWQALWLAIQAAFTVRTMRLAPLILVMALVWLSSFSLVSLAQEALPGDIAYPVKQWMRFQELNLAPPSLRPQVLEKHERELHEDILKAAVKAEDQAGAPHDLNIVVIKTSGIMTYHGEEGCCLVIGGLQVLKKYQPDANKNQAFIDMAIEGKLAPGKQVVLEYQILATQNGTVVTPVVQGIALRVLEDAPVVPTPMPTKLPPPTKLPTPTNTSIPTYTATPADVKPCIVKPIAGWHPIVIFSGDTLETIALRTNTSVASLMLANCLAANAMPMNGLLLAPDVIASVTPTSDVTVVPPPSTTVVPTATNPTGESTPTTPEATLTATAATITATVVAATPEATSAEQTATVATTAVVTASNTAEATTSTPTATATEKPFPTVTPTLMPTDAATESTAVASSSPTPSPTAPLPTATATPSITPVPSVTPEPSATATEVRIPSSTDTPTVVNLPTPVNTPTVLDTPTIGSSSVSTPLATQTAMPTPTTASVERPTATLVEPTPIPPTPVPPTPVPPTPIPPTPVPPTPIPPTPIPPTPVPAATEASAPESRFRARGEATTRPGDLPESLQKLIHRAR